MKALRLSLLMLMVCFPAHAAWAGQAESHQRPDRLTRTRGVVHYNYNITEELRDLDGQADEVMYAYDYVVIEPPVTKAKIMTALAKEKHQAVDVEGLEAENDAVQARLAEIAALSFSQVDAHIDETFSGLPETQRASLKTLYKAVLALIKYGGLD